MIKKLKNALHASRDSLISEEIHFRLCHVCLKLNESEEEIVECQGCQCPFTADDSWDVAGYERSQSTAAKLTSEEEGELTPIDAYARRARRLMGLLVRW